jgi:phosphate transport system substrate-binding protein
MTMNDDFLHRIRAEPPPHFIASLKARLNRLEKESLTRRPVRRRGFFLGSMIAGAALATGLFVTRTMYSPQSDNLQPTPVTNPSSVDDHRPGPAPQASGSKAPDVLATSQGKAAVADRTPGQLGIGATVSIYPNIKEATRFFTKLNTNPPFPEPMFSMMSSAAVFPSLCASSNSLDAVVVDRRILPEELDVCHRLHKRITEIKLGYEAIVLARSNLYDPPKLSSRSIFLALAREVPDPLHPEELIKNPYVTWDQVDSALPNERIDVSGPPLSAAVGIAFRDLILKAGCSALPTIASLKETDPERFEEVCGAVRTDGVYRVSEASQGAGNNPFDFVGYLQANPAAVALLGYQEDLLRAWNLSAGSIDGGTPSRSVIYSGSYPGSRTLYLYANTNVPGMREFIYSILSSVGGARVDTPVMFVDSAELRNLREHVWALPDLQF